MRVRQTTTAMALALMALGAPAWADIEAAKAFLDAEIGELSSLDRAAQEAEMQWFIDAAQPFQGMEINVVSAPVAACLNRICRPVTAQVTYPPGDRMS